MLEVRNLHDHNKNVISQIRNENSAFTVSRKIRRSKLSTKWTLLPQTKELSHTLLAGLVGFLTAFSDSWQLGRFRKQNALLHTHNPSEILANSFVFQTPAKSLAPPLLLSQNKYVTTVTENTHNNQSCLRQSIIPGRPTTHHVHTTVREDAALLTCDGDQTHNKCDYVRSCAVLLTAGCSTCCTVARV